MKNTVVYADLTFLVNFFMDFALLWVTTRLVGVRVLYRRLLATAALAALYGTGCLFPAIQVLYCLPVKLAMSILLVCLALVPVSWAKFKKGLLLFYLLSFVAAGAAQAVYYMVAHNPWRINASWLWLGAGMFCLLFIGYQGERYFLRRLAPALLKYLVVIRFDRLSCSAPGFLDTGNGLCDPLTRRPVIVAEYGVIEGCLPQDLRQAIDEQGGQTDIWKAVSGSSWAHRLRIIPYRTVGQEHGIMVGLRADEVVVKMGEEDIIYRDLVVGVYHDRLSCDESYHMLIPSALLVDC